jgi:hypothetical protein
MHSFPTNQPKFQQRQMCHHLGRTLNKRVNEKIGSPNQSESPLHLSLLLQLDLA